MMLDFSDEGRRQRYLEQETRPNGWRQQFWYAPDGSYDLDHCRVCRGELDAEHKAWARRQLQPVVCSTVCQLANDLQYHACCEQARHLSRYCVCALAFECPVHGETHIGTHD
jgi:hypothetical protein